MTTPGRNRRRATMAGFRAIGPMLPGVVPFGMTAGIAALEAGLGPAVGIGLSIIVFAGAAQLVIAQLIGDGALPIIVVLTALVINLRMVMYSASLAPYFGNLSMAWKTTIAYLLTDQAYAVSITRFMAGLDRKLRPWYYLGVAAPIWTVWLTATVLGVWVGAAIPEAWQIGFALPLVFLVLLVPVVRSRPSVIAAAVGGSVAVIAYSAPYHLGLTLGAIAGVVSGVMAESLLSPTEESRE
ncbi:4-azaleucine resistance transporter AzlC [Natronocella acetinitrilica]|uniref:4-azaleucine resistance transporter AzlC n=1 Tax=Natronocella acetinitrilica TaxID=414046 RepID=A0AAE3KD80_9GAMM|nr:AzlC family ABC transporter permease [Natronocella acetinitrilica]MCP1675948.1 4-azaleucine resistance transporter AzlC [Natronocella acetinitrilica]